ncbi:MAG: DUF3325 domain-containing protein [Candidatus Accumulibacter sp.]|jgi:hypothetical protein|nr:DUF3325 domain-containing protein [Accumulibacter sp.]
METLLLTLAAAGLGFLASGMERHAKQIFGKATAPRFRNSCAGIGWAGLGLTLMTAIRAYGVSTGIAVFFGVTAAVSLGFALILAYRPRLLLLAVPASVFAAFLVILT